jgi:rhodanese-related sulfurtransferase
LEFDARKRAGADFVLLDVRTEEELAIVCLPDCIHIPLNELESRIDELRSHEEREIVVLCHHGGRSAFAQQMLIGRGYSNVTNLVGGINRYAVEVDPSVRQY